VSFTWNAGTSLADAIATAASRTGIRPEEVYYRGHQIPKEADWTDFSKIANRRKPLELVSAYTGERTDGNFNSSIDDTVTEQELQLFRYSERFTFLTADLLRDNPEYRAAGVRAHPEFMRRALSEYSESQVGWNERDLARVRDGALAAHTYVHLYYAAVLARCIPARSLSVLEVGGGYGGLARVLGKLAPDVFCEYSIVDIPFVTGLQHLLLSKDFPGEVTANANNSNGTPASRFRLFDTAHSEAALRKSYDLVIATHSLSELDPRQIRSYVEGALAPARNVLLSLQLKFHENIRGYSHQDCSWISERLQERGFESLYENRTEDGRVVTTLLSRTAGAVSPKQPTS
jgi:putative sugar O-methyltransferase